MKTHFLQHVPFEGLGSIETWLVARQAELSRTRFYMDESLPDPSTLDFVIAGPGPMSVNDEAELPWLKVEKQFLREAISLDIPVLGICLGAQLIASSLGAHIYSNPVREIGWFPIRAESVSGDCFQFPEECSVFHWHGETFDLPQNAVHLASSAGCLNQGFQIGRRVIGLQFHLETTPQSAKMLIENSWHEMQTGPFVQSEAEIMAALPDTYRAINSLMNEVLGYLLEGGSPHFDIGRGCPR